MGRKHKWKKLAGYKASPGPGAVVTHGGGTQWHGGHKCHTGPALVYTLGGTRIHGGSKTEIMFPRRKWDLLLVCAGKSMAPEPEIILSPSAQNLLPPDMPERGAVPWIALDWFDGSVPPLGNRAWQQIADAVASVKGDVGVYCMGGHGRTGAALAILASLHGMVPLGSDPVAWVRKRYCEEAVETDSQCNYVERITGDKVTSRGSERHYYGGNEFDFGFRPTPKAPATVSVPSPSLPASDSALDAIAPEAGGRKGTPLMNSAGEIIGWDYTTGDSNGSKPWIGWGK